MTADLARTRTVHICDEATPNPIACIEATEWSDGSTVLDVAGYDEYHGVSLEIDQAGAGALVDYLTERFNL